MGCSCSKWRAPCSGCAAKLIPSLLGGVGCEGNGVAAVDEECWMRQIKAPCSCYGDESCRVAIRRTSVQQKGGLFIAKGANGGFTGGQKSC